MTTKKKTTIWHKLFKCPTFWRLRPSFHCPICGNGYRCYWDGNDCGGKIDVCNECAATMKKEKDTGPPVLQEQDLSRLECGDAPLVL